MKRRYAFLLLAVVSLVGIVAVPAEVWAQQSSSTTYSVDEVFFGTGGELEACGTAYCSKQAAGELGVGETTSTNYGAQGGFNTNREEYIELTVTGANIDLGILSTSSAATATGAFSVKTYLSSGGYVVTNASDPPTYQSQTINNLTSPTASSPGTEQFGINLVANTSPTTFGANPVQSPDSTFSFGAAATGYNTANQFKYVKGDIIATSNGKSTGTTNYTISYLYNISGQTEAGQYTFAHDVVATSTY
jgi:hypothetical protein